MKEKKMTLKKFNEKYRKTNCEWNFKAFKIVCVKCKSDRVEYDGKMEIEYGYYGSFDAKATIVIKCHSCGNAFTINKEDGGSIDYCACDR